MLPEAHLDITVKGWQLRLTLDDKRSCYRNITSSLPSLTFGLIIYPHQYIFR